MKRLVWASLAFMIAAVLAASCVPDFQFREPSGAGGGTAGGGAIGGEGGQATAGATGGEGGGGGAGGAGGAGGSGGSGGSVPPVVIVPCGAMQWHVDACPPSEFCCWHETSYACDVCTQGGTCTGPVGCGGVSNYRLLRCNGPEDCPVGQHCCEDVTEDTLCAVACNASQNVICGVNEDCPMEKPYCVEFATPYPGYKLCSATAP